MADDSDKVTYEQAAQLFERKEVTIRDWARQGLIMKYTKPLDRHVYVSVSQIRALVNGEFRPKEGKGGDAGN